MSARQVRIEIDAIALQGLLRLPAEAVGLVLFAHGSGSGHRSPRNNFVAGELAAAKIGSLLFDLLTEAEERIDAATAELRFDIPLLTGRLRDRRGFGVFLIGFELTLESLQSRMLRRIDLAFLHEFGT